MSRAGDPGNILFYAHYAVVAQSGCGPELVSIPT